MERAQEHYQVRAGSPALPTHCLSPGEHQLGLWTKSTAKQLLVVTRAEPLLTGCAGHPELHHSLVCDFLHPG